MDPVAFEKFARLIEESSKFASVNRPIARQWAEISESDIRASKILLKEGLFPQSVYFLQQAYEKILKSFYLISGRIKPPDIKGHNFNIKQLKKDTEDQFVGDTIFLLKEFAQNDNPLQKVSIKKSYLMNYISTKMQ